AAAYHHVSITNHGSASRRCICVQSKEGHERRALDVKVQGFVARRKTAIAATGLLHPTPARHRALPAFTFAWTILVETRRPQPAAEEAEMRNLHVAVFVNVSERQSGWRPNLL